VNSKRSLPSALAAAVYATRVRNGWSQAGMAREVRCNMKLIADMERGIRPGFLMLARIGQFTRGVEREVVIDELRQMAPGEAWDLLRQTARSAAA
jgi:transcriptional regulator with XRE-family HTH domain